VDEKPKLWWFGFLVRKFCYVFRSPIERLDSDAITEEKIRSTSARKQSKMEWVDNT
jgi:hypothetical protein